MSSCCKFWEYLSGRDRAYPSWVLGPYLDLELDGLTGVCGLSPRVSVATATSSSSSGWGFGRDPGLWVAFVLTTDVTVPTPEGSVRPEQGPRLRPHEALPCALRGILQ